MIKIAIDPGKNGGAAILQRMVAGREVVTVQKYPESRLDIVNILDEYEYRDIKAIIEKQHVFPGSQLPVKCPKCGRISSCCGKVIFKTQPQGAKSTWSLSQNYERWLMALAMRGVPHIEVSSAKWMSKIGVLPSDKKERKNRLKEMAAMRYSNCDFRVTLWNSDALMMLTVFDEIWR